jgi:hypothetical protein
MYEDCVAKLATPISFRIDADVKAALEQAAADDSRSISGLAQLILRQWLTEKGYLSEPRNTALAGKATVRRTPRR